jgi:hypothetical protein
MRARNSRRPGIATRGKKYYMPRKVIRRKNKKEALMYYYTFPKFFAMCCNKQIAQKNEFLKLENRELRQQKMNLEHEMMLSCWDDHDPHTLRSAFKAYNRTPLGLLCNCRRCCLMQSQSIDYSKGEPIKQVCALFFYRHVHRLLTKATGLLSL